MYITYALYIFLRLLLLLFKSTHKNLAPCDRNKEYQFSSRYYKKKYDYYKASSEAVHYLWY